MTSKHRRRRVVRRAHHQRTARDTNCAARQGLTLEQYRLVQQGTPVEWAKEFAPGEPVRQVNLPRPWASVPLLWLTARNQEAFDSLVKGTRRLSPIFRGREQ